MMAPPPRAWGALPGSARIRCRPEDFRVTEELGFAPSGDGEHAFLYLEKRGLNTLDLARRIAILAGVPRRDIGYSGLKDRNALTRQWFSVGLAGKPEPAWRELEDGGAVRVLEVTRHQRKLRRGVHRANRFSLVLRDLVAERGELNTRLGLIAQQGVPNYFGEQRFGRDGATLGQALAWSTKERRATRNQRSLYLSALRSHLFNELLGYRVSDGAWNTVCAADICLLRGTNSRFLCEAVDADIRRRVACGDISPAVPLWGAREEEQVLEASLERLRGVPRGLEIADFLERSGSVLNWRCARLLPDDFCWQFCDDGSLQLDFALGAGSYATALLAECVHYKEGRAESGTGSEQG